MEVGKPGSTLELRVHEGYQLLASYAVGNK